MGGLALQRGFGRMIAQDAEIDHDINSETSDGVECREWAPYR